MNLVLIGYRGSGKSSVGRLLGQRLGLVFVDVDRLIRERFGGLNVAQIWERFGEPAFRQAEEEVTRQVCARDGQVIALGGGTLMFAGSRQAVESAPAAVRVYLHCTPDELHRRIHNDPAGLGDRPSLTAAGGGLEEIRLMLERREPVYRAVAQHVVDVTHLTPQAAADAVARLAQN